jgi:hypothetical protein
VLEHRGLTVDQVTVSRVHGYHEVPVADVAHSGEILDGNRLHRVAKPHEPPVVVATQLPGVCLTPTGLETTGVIAASAYRLLVVHLAGAT